MSIARAVAPASAALAIAALLLMLWSMSAGAEPPEAVQPPAGAVSSAEALRTLKVRLVTALLIALSAAPASSGSQAVMLLQARTGSGEVAARTGDRGLSATPLPHLMTANSSSD